MYNIEVKVNGVWYFFINGGVMTTKKSQASAYLQTEVQNKVKEIIIRMRKTEDEVRYTKV